MFNYVIFYMSAMKHFPFSIIYRIASQPPPPPPQIIGYQLNLKSFGHVVRQQKFKRWFLEPPPPPSIVRRWGSYFSCTFEGQMLTL